MKGNLFRYVRLGAVVSGLSVIAYAVVLAACSDNGNCSSSLTSADIRLTNNGSGPVTVTVKGPCSGPTNINVPVFTGTFTNADGEFEKGVGDKFEFTSKSGSSTGTKVICTATQAMVDAEFAEVFISGTTVSCGTNFAEFTGS